MTTEEIRYYYLDSYTPQELYTNFIEPIELIDETLELWSNGHLTDSEALYEIIKDLRNTDMQAVARAEALSVMHTVT